MSDKPTLGSVAGELSGIVSGIFVDSKVALDLGPKTSSNVQMERDYYRWALDRIRSNAARGEGIWAEYFKENKSVEEKDLANDEKMAYPIQKPIGFKSWTAWVREQEKRN